MNYVPPRRSDGTIQTRRPQQPWPADKPFRILSIDGGGICGILPASVLADLEQRFLGGQSVAHHFDMIAGTSTGGIIALGLAHGLTASAVRDFYVKRGGKIFPPPTRIGRFVRLLRRGHRYAYERGPLENELLEIFGDSVLGQARTRLCIPSFEGRHGEPWIFKTPHHPHYQKDRVERMVKVALSTAAAPTFFEALPNNGYVMVDGGLWANNPVMNALVDALSCYELDRAQVEILSLGCGETAFKVDERMSRGGDAAMARRDRRSHARPIAQRPWAGLFAGRERPGDAGGRPGKPEPDRARRLPARPRGTTGHGPLFGRRCGPGDRPGVLRKHGRPVYPLSHCVEQRSTG